MSSDASPGNPASSTYTGHGVERVWNLEALSGLRVVGFPLEELLFAIAFGAYWSGVYEHLTWHRAR